MSKTKIIKVTVVSESLAKALGVKAGDRYGVECRDGVPVMRYWRNRFKDAPIDGSISVPTVSKPKATEKS